MMLHTRLHELLQRDRSSYREMHPRSFGGGIPAGELAGASSS